MLAAKKLEGGYTTHSALDMLPPFHMDMGSGAGALEAPPTTVVIRLTNPGGSARPSMPFIHSWQAALRCSITN